VAGSGAIACGLAAAATALGEVRLLARSDTSAWRAEEGVEKLCGKVKGGTASRLRVTTRVEDLAGCDLIVEAVAEDPEVKVAVHTELAGLGADADIATTTSSLGVEELGRRVGAADRFYGLHVFNPVAKMELVELCLPDGLADGVGNRARAFCDALGKRAIEVPDLAGFVVNRLLFPYLFDAIRLLESTGMPVADVDDCMSMGTNHPMGPLRLVDVVGIDVAIAIGRGLHADSGSERHAPPPLLEEMAAAGKLGRKSGAGFYEY
jgi:3-hydroxybutyryl-CoA dehydrogenase